MARSAPATENQTAPANGNGGSVPTGFGAWTQRAWFKTEVLLRVLLLLLIVIAGTWLAAGLWQVVIAFSSLLLLFFASWLVALMLTPLVRRFVAFNWPIPLSIGAVYVLVLAGLIGFGVLVLPGLIAQTQLLSQNLGGITRELEKNLNKTLKTFGINNVDLAQASSQFQSFGNDLLKNALNVVTGIASFLVQLLLLLIISFSILSGREYSGLGNKSSGIRPSLLGPTLWQRFPTRWRRWGDYAKLSFERNFGVFLLGQFTVAAFYGTVTGIVMWISGFDYPITTGCMCGALMILPFFGGPLSLLPPLIVAFNRDDSPIVIVLIMLFIFQTLLLNVVLPKIVGKSSGVGPVTTLFVLLAGAQIGGVFGVLMAVPITGVMKSLGTAFLNDFLNREENKNGLPPTPPQPPSPITKVDFEVPVMIGTDKE